MAIWNMEWNGSCTKQIEKKYDIYFVGNAMAWADTFLHVYELYNISGLSAKKNPFLTSECGILQ